MATRAAPPKRTPMLTAPVGREASAADSVGGASLAVASVEEVLEPADTVAVEVTDREPLPVEEVTDSVPVTEPEVPDSVGTVVVVSVPVAVVSIPVAVTSTLVEAVLGTSTVSLETTGTVKVLLPMVGIAVSTLAEAVLAVTKPVGVVAVTTLASVGTVGTTGVSEG